MKNIIFFAIFLLVVFIGGFLVSVSFYNDAISIAEKAAKTELQMITAAVANDLNYILSDTGRDLNLIAHRFRKGKIPSQKDLNDIFNNFYTTNSYLQSLWYNDKNGIRKTSVPLEQSCENGNDYSFRNYFKEAKKYKQTVYSEVLPNFRPKGIEKPYDSIVIVTPVFDNGNNFFGVVGADVNITAIEERIQAEFLAKVPTRTGLYCVDFENSRIVAGPKKKNKITADYEKFIVDISNSTDFNEMHNTIKTYKGDKYFIAGNIIQNPAYSFDLLGVFPYDETMAYIPTFYTQIKWLALFAVTIIIMATVIVVYNQAIFKRLRKQIKTLEIHIDEQEKKTAVADVVDSEYLINLLAKIDKLKKDKKD
jgi:hypothetical protein